HVRDRHDRGGRADPYDSRPPWPSDGTPTQAHAGPTASQHGPAARSFPRHPRLTPSAQPAPTQARADADTRAPHDPAVSPNHAENSWQPLVRLVFGANKGLPRILGVVGRHGGVVRGSGVGVRARL